MPDKSIKEVPCGMVVWAGVSACSRSAFLLVLILAGKQKPQNYPRFNGAISYRPDQARLKR
jgi:hypothetical protein